jgi:hypothetical protein
MTRIAVILAFAIAACDVGSVVTNNQGGPDGSMNTGGPDGSGSVGSNGSNCDAVSNTPPDGHHNAGQTCLQSGCHLVGQAGANAPEYSVAGTLWRDSGGASPYPGATIEITVGGTTRKIVTASNGNFFSTPQLTTAPTAGTPGTTKASACPSTTPMSGQLVDNGGNCNNCHRTGGTTTPIYLQ